MDRKKELREELRKQGKTFFYGASVEKLESLLLEEAPTNEVE